MRHIRKYFIKTSLLKYISIFIINIFPIELSHKLLIILIFKNTKLLCAYSFITIKFLEFLEFFIKVELQ